MKTTPKRQQRPRGEKRLGNGSTTPRGIISQSEIEAVEALDHAHEARLRIAKQLDSEFGYTHPAFNAAQAAFEILLGFAVGG